MRYFNNKKRTRKNKRVVTKKIISSTIIITALGIASAAYASSSLVVIANPHLKLSKLSKSQLANLYLGKSIALPHGVELEPINLPSDANAYQMFYRTVLGWTPSKVSGYWSSMIFSGGGNQPQTVDDVQTAISDVQKYQDVIAYVSSNDLKNVRGVKALYGHYTPPPPPVQNNPYYHSADSGYVYSNNGSGFHSMYQQSTNSYSNSNSSDQNLQVQTPPNYDQLEAALEKEIAVLKHQQAQYESVQTENVWQEIQSNIHINPKYKNNPRVRHELLYFSSHPQVIKQMLTNAAPYISYVYQQVQSRHMPTKFALLPMVESGYDPYAYSSAGAAGLWQLMPGTASSYGLKINWWYDQRRDILTSTNSALNFLVTLHKNLGTWPLAAAGYNAGQGAVQSAIDFNKSHGRPLDYWALPLPQQTRYYVPKLLAIAEIIKNPKRYGITLPDVPSRPFFVAFKMKSQMDMAEISQLSGVPISMIRELNPGFRRWATEPGAEYILLIPKSNAAEFSANLAKDTGKAHISWQYHRVSQGETLASLASQYKTKASVLRSINNLQSNTLRSGDGILVPVLLNKTYQDAGIINIQTDSTRVASMKTEAPAKPVVQTNAASSDTNNVISKINTDISNKISASDILSGKLPSLSSRQNAPKTVHDESSLAHDLPVVRSISTTNPQAAHQSYHSNDANHQTNLKTLMNKIYSEK